MPLDAARKALERLGGKHVGVSLTMGPYDFVSVFDAPDDETAAKYIMAVSARGYVKTISLRRPRKRTFGESSRVAGTRDGNLGTSRRNQPMQTYLVLGTFTELGRRTIEDSPKRLHAVRKALTKIGGSLASFHLTMGAQDFVAVLVAPSDETIIKYALAVAAHGHVKVAVSRAFTEAEYRALIKG